MSRIVRDTEQHGPIEAPADYDFDEITTADITYDYAVRLINPIRDPAAYLAGLLNAHAHDDPTGDYAPILDDCCAIDWASTETLDEHERFVVWSGEIVEVIGGRWGSVDRYEEE